MAYRTLLLVLVAISLTNCTSSIPKNSPSHKNTETDIAEYYKGQAAFDNRDYKTAFQIWSASAQAGDAKSQFVLGSLYINGQGVARDPEQALKWYHKAAESGNPNAQMNLGMKYQYGLDGISRDINQAIVWYKKAADQGDQASLILLTMLYSDIGNEEALSWLRKSAEDGNMNAQVNLGMKYHYGKGVPADDVQALAWYRKAADRGDAFAQYHAGSMHEDGDGTPIDNAQAVIWYRKAAQQGYLAAQLSLWEMYKKDNRLIDRAEALSWYRKAADQGDSEAQNFFKTHREQ